MSMRNTTFAGIIAGTLASAPVLAADQTEAVERAGQEAEKAGADVTKKQLDEAEKATKQEAEKATEQIDQSAEKAKQEIDAEAKSAKEQVEGTEKAKLSEDEMEEQLEAKLQKDSQLRGSVIEADVNDQGAVTLTGTVPSESAKTRALKLTSQTKGVKEVNDKLEVASPTP